MRASAKRVRSGMRISPHYGTTITGDEVAPQRLEQVVVAGILSQRAEARSTSVDRVLSAIIAERASNERPENVPGRMVHGA